MPVLRVLKVPNLPLRTLTKHGSWFFHQTMKTTVTTKNMVTIPAELSRQLGISPGCQLDWEAVSGKHAEIRVRVIPKRGELARRLMGMGKKWSPDRDAVAELIAERTREEEEQALS